MAQDLYIIRELIYICKISDNKSVILIFEIVYVSAEEMVYI